MKDKTAGGMGIAVAEFMSDEKLRGVHVLLVEDTDDTRELLREALQYCGALVTTAASKKEAERLLRDLKPHVIVSDIAMPDDGMLSFAMSWKSRTNGERRFL